MPEARWSAHQMAVSLAKIAETHRPLRSRSGSHLGYCQCCDREWPCPTYAWATTPSTADAPWRPSVDPDPRPAHDTFKVPATDPVLGIPMGTREIRTHTQESCKGERACPIHRPSQHHMCEWPKLWRSDTGVLERTCPHGIGHPDPDQFEFWAKTGIDGRKIHGCDGCCKPGDSQ